MNPSQMAASAIPSAASVPAVTGEAAPNSDLAEQFENLARKWRRETAHLSRLDQIFLNPSYQRIIGMGRAAVPLILASLQRECGMWFWALTSITGYEPFQGGQGISVEQMQAAWLKWGHENAPA